MLGSNIVVIATCSFQNSVSKTFGFKCQEIISKFGTQYNLWSRLKVHRTCENNELQFDGKYR